MNELRTTLQSIETQRDVKKYREACQKVRVRVPAVAHVPALAQTLMAWLNSTGGRCKARVVHRWLPAMCRPSPLAAGQAREFTDMNRARETA